MTKHSTVHGQALYLTFPAALAPMFSLSPKSIELCSGLCGDLTRYEGQGLQSLPRTLQRLQRPGSEKAQAFVLWPQRHTPTVLACILLSTPRFTSRPFPRRPPPAWSPSPAPLCLGDPPPAGIGSQLPGPSLSVSSGCGPSAH